MKKFIAIILSATAMLSCSTSVFAEETKKIEITQSVEIKNAKSNRIESPTQILPDKNQKVFVNDKQVELKDGTIVYENRLYLPVRELGYALGLEVGYVTEHKIVALDNGKIQLPVNENKAVVNGQIVAIDKENDKVGTIVVNNKTYLPVRFISENLGYSVSYDATNKVTNIKTNNNMAQNDGVTKLDKAQAAEAYKKLYEASNSIKNATVETVGKMKITMPDGEKEQTMTTDIVSTSYIDIKDKVNMYTEQKNTLELLGEKQVIEQKIFYKDGKMYTSQNVDGTETKYKMDLDLEKAMELSNSQKINELLDANVVLGGSVKELENGNKEYRFELDMNKSMEISQKFAEQLGLTTEDLKTLNINITNYDIVTIVDSKNQPVESKIALNMSFKQEDVDLKMVADINMKYKNVGTTVVNMPNEDLSKYEEVKDAE